MKYYFIAGEASGDLHASNLIKELRKKDEQAEIRAWGGDLMQKQGANVVKHYRDLAFMGFAEVIMNLFTILRNIKACKKDIEDFQPDVLVFIDYPGFNLRIAEWAHKKGLKTAYYISPQVWAWKKNRVYQIKKYIDEMIVILPFEKDFYIKYDYKVSYVGHPLLDALPKAEKNHVEFTHQHQLNNKPIIALLPGSRKQEINKMLSIMLQQLDLFPDYQFVIAGAPGIEDSFYQEFLKNNSVSLLKGASHKLLQHSYAALVTSGTATLETALIGIPEVVCYKGNRISYEIAKRIVEIKYISLVNLIMDKEVVTELIQNNLNTKNLQKELQNILSQKERAIILKEYEKLKLKLGDGGASERAAQIVRQLASSSC
ncbi:MAG: lipid-A-disaccharide synthase [Bacteroidetes bacterium 4572_77]|nr:MAG: lipid-A-disaccharide synthase [Bacteroidetes bacterium 4572_77]